MGMSFTLGGCGEKTIWVSIPLKIPQAWLPAIRAVNSKTGDSQTAIARKAFRYGLPLVAREWETMQREILRGVKTAADCSHSPIPEAVGIPPAHESSRTDSPKRRSRESRRKPTRRRGAGRGRQSRRKG